MEWEQQIKQETGAYTLHPHTYTHADLDFKKIIEEDTRKNLNNNKKKWHAQNVHVWVKIRVEEASKRDKIYTVRNLKSWTKRVKNKTN